MTVQWLEKYGYVMFCSCCFSSASAFVLTALIWIGVAYLQKIGFGWKKEAHTCQFHFLWLGLVHTLVGMSKFTLLRYWKQLLENMAVLRGSFPGCWGNMYLSWQIDVTCRWSCQFIFWKTLPTNSWRSMTHEIFVWKTSWLLLLHSPLGVSFGKGNCS